MASLVFSADEFARWQLVFLQRPVPSPHPFPLAVLHLWNLQGIPLCVQSRFEQIHLYNFPVDIVTDLSIYNIPT